MDGIDAFFNLNPAARQYEMSLHALAYNMKRLLRIVGTRPLMQMMRT